MLPTITLELTADEAKTMLPVLESQRRDLQQKLHATEAKIAAINSALNGQQVIPAVTANKTATGRIKKGESDKLIFNYLGSLSGKSASLREIAKATGVSSSSAYRSLKRLEGNKITQNRGSLWSLAEVQ